MADSRRVVRTKVLNRQLCADVDAFGYELWRDARVAWRGRFQHFMQSASEYKEGVSKHTPMPAIVAEHSRNSDGLALLLESGALNRAYVTEFAPDQSANARWVGCTGIGHNAGNFARRSFWVGDKALPQATAIASVTGLAMKINR